MDADNLNRRQALRAYWRLLTDLPGPPLRRWSVAAAIPVEMLGIFLALSKLLPIPYLRYVLAAWVAALSLAPLTIVNFTASSLIWPTDERGRGPSDPAFWNRE